MENNQKRKAAAAGQLDPCYHKCKTFTKQIQPFKKEFVLAFYVSTLSTNEKSSHKAAAGRKWKNKLRKSVRAVVFNPTCVSIYNLSMDIIHLFCRCYILCIINAWIKSWVTCYIYCLFNIFRVACAAERARRHPRETNTRNVTIWSGNC